MSAIERLGIRSAYSGQTYSEVQEQTSDTFGFKWAKVKGFCDRAGLRPST